MYEYEYLAVHCKNPGCGQVILLDCKGPRDTFVLDPAQRLDNSPIEVTCRICGRTSSYELSEIHKVMGFKPAADFRPHPAFRVKAKAHLN
jgi:hypothetical protein